MPLDRLACSEPGVGVRVPNDEVAVFASAARPSSERETPLARESRSETRGACHTLSPYQTTRGPVSAPGSQSNASTGEPDVRKRLIGYSGSLGDQICRGAATKSSDYQRPVSMMRRKRLHYLNGFARGARGGCQQFHVLAPADRVHRVLAIQSQSFLVKVNSIMDDLSNLLVVTP